MLVRGEASDTTMPRRGPYKTGGPVVMTRLSPAEHEALRRIRDAVHVDGNLPQTVRILIRDRATQLAMQEQLFGPKPNPKREGAASS